MKPGDIVEVMAAQHGLPAGTVAMIHSVGDRTASLAHMGHLWISVPRTGLRVATASTARSFVIAQASEFANDNVESFVDKREAMARHLRKYHAYEVAYGRASVSAMGALADLAESVASVLAAEARAREV